MKPFDTYNDVKVKVAAKADALNTMPIVSLLLVSVIVLLLGGTASGY